MVSLTMMCVSKHAHSFNICQSSKGLVLGIFIVLRIMSPDIKQQAPRFTFGLIVNIWAATRKATGCNPVQSHLIDV